APQLHLVRGGRRRARRHQQAGDHDDGDLGLPALLLVGVGGAVVLLTRFGRAFDPRHLRGVAGAPRGLRRHVAGSDQARVRTGEVGRAGGIGARGRTGRVGGGRRIHIALGGGGLGVVVRIEGAAVLGHVHAHDVDGGQAVRIERTGRAREGRSFRLNGEALLLGGILRALLLVKRAVLRNLRLLESE